MAYGKTYSSYKKRASGNRLTKRWYVDANVPKSIPFIGGASFKAGSGNLTKRSLTTMIRQTGENKQKIVAAQNTTGLTHNTIYTFNPFGNIPIQAGVNGRLGAGIYIKNWTINMLFTNIGATSTTTEIHYRVMVVNTDAQYLSGSDAFASGVGSSDIFVQGSAYLVNSLQDRNRCTVVSDQLVKLTPQITTTGIVQQRISVSCCKGKLLKFLSPTSNYVAGKNTYILVIPYVCNGTSGTTVVGTLQSESLVDFTDV